MDFSVDRLNKLTRVPKGKRRIWELDALRGICILLMLFDHVMCDFIMVPGWALKTSPSHALMESLSTFAAGYWFNPVRYAVRMAVLFSFMLLSGISCSFSRSNGNRLFKLTAVALIFTAFTYGADALLGMGIAIPFGIPHILALSLLIYILLTKLFDNKFFFLAVGVLIVIGGVLIDFQNIGQELDFNINNFHLIISGLRYFGVDSYGVLPYTGVFLIGVFVGRTVYFDRYSLLPAFDLPVLKPLCFIGRNTLIIYVLHQLLIAGAVILFAMSLGYTFF